MTFHKVVVFIGAIVLLIAFVITLNIRNKYVNDKGLNNFFIVPLIGILITANTILTNVLKVQNYEEGGFIERILFAIEFCFWIYFFHSIGLKILKYKVFTLMLICAVGITAFIVSYNFSSNRFHHYTNSFFLILESLFCLVYLNKLFSEPPKLPLFKNPIFLIVTALLIKCSVAVPVLLATEIMYVGKNSKFYLILFPFSNIAILLMYVQFIYAFMCIRKNYMKNLGIRTEISEK